jgi:cell fate regulator YaaT (PSP1 superfamily)
MPKIVGIRFRKVGKIYHFDARGLQDLRVGEHVIVDTSRGKEVGQVACVPREQPKGNVRETLKPIERRAEPLDLVQMEHYRLREAEALALCQERVGQRGLPIKLLQAEYNYDGSHLVLYFVSEKRIDFRGLVQELSKTLKSKVELRQVGVRDEAKLMGGVGRCGRLLCCATFMQEFDPVSIKMAKRQDISLSPSEISGLCGRLLCCLAYEDEYYQQVKKKLPKVGDTVETSYGTGEVKTINALTETVSVELKNEVRIEVPAEEILEVQSKRKGKRS